MENKKMITITKDNIVIDNMIFVTQNDTAFEIDHEVKRPKLQITNNLVYFNSYIISPPKLIRFLIKLKLLPNINGLIVSLDGGK